MTRPNILIFKRDLLPYSETFIREQAEALTAFEPIYVGLHRTPGLELPASRVMVVNDGSVAGWARGGAYRVLGRDPATLSRLKGLGAGLMHAHFENGGIAALGLAEALGIPLVTTCHGSDVTTEGEFSHPNPVLRRIYARRLRGLQSRGQRFLAVSEFIKAKMMARGYPVERTGLHYIGVDVDKFKPTSGVQREEMVLHVGRLVDKKGCRYLIEAMAEVQRTRPEVELVVLGDGPLRAGLEDQAGRCLTAFRFLGVRSPEEVRYLMNRAKVLAVPSITTDRGGSEGLPIVALEALSMCLPVVGFNHAGIAEVVSPYGLVAERDVAGLAQRIEGVLTDSGRWVELSTAGRHLAVRDFSLGAQVVRLEAIYAEVMAQYRAKASA